MLPAADTTPARDTPPPASAAAGRRWRADRKSTRLNSSHPSTSYAVFCLKKKNTRNKTRHCLIMIRNIRALNGKFNPSIIHDYSLVIDLNHITLNATVVYFFTPSKQFRHV